MCHWMVLNTGVKGKWSLLGILALTKEPSTVAIPPSPAESRSCMHWADKRRILLMTLTGMEPTSAGPCLETGTRRRWVGKFKGRHQKQLSLSSHSSTHKAAWAGFQQI